MEGTEGGLGGQVGDYPQPQDVDARRLPRSSIRLLLPLGMLVRLLIRKPQCFVSMQLSEHAPLMRLVFNVSGRVPVYTRVARLMRGTHERGHWTQALQRRILKDVLLTKVPAAML